MTEDIEQIKRLSNILCRARANSNPAISQDQMAMILGTSKNTVYNIEKGTSEISLRKAIKWLSVCGVSQYAAFMELFYPDLYEKVEEFDDEAFFELFKSLPVKTKKQLMYQLSGIHGSSPIAYQNKIMADLLSPLYDRNSSANLTLNSYKLRQATGELLECEEDLKPDIGLLECAINASLKAIKDRNEAYDISERRGE